jgi:hypothetical protein
MSLPTAIKRLLPVTLLLSRRGTAGLDAIGAFTQIRAFRGNFGEDHFEQLNYSFRWPNSRWWVERDAGIDAVLRRRDRPVKEGQSHERLLSGYSPTDRKMADAHHLDALVVRQLLTDGGLGDESLTAHGAHEWQRELFRYLQHMDGVVTTAFPQIGSDGQ